MGISPLRFATIPPKLNLAIWSNSVIPFLPFSAPLRLGVLSSTDTTDAQARAPVGLPRHGRDLTPVAAHRLGADAHARLDHRDSSQRHARFERRVRRVSQVCAGRRFEVP